MNRKLNHALASLVLMYSATAWAQQADWRDKEATMATLNGQDEYQLSGSAECGGEATFEATIKPGERFIASCHEKDCDVYLKSGISGTIPRNRIRLLPNEPLARLNFASCKKEWRKLQSKRIKSSADDDTDGEIQHIASHGKFFKFLEHLISPSEGSQISRR